MKKFLFGILSVIGLFSFCGAYSVTYTGSFSYNYTRSLGNTNMVIFPLDFPVGPMTGNCVINNLNGISDSLTFKLFYYYGGNYGRNFVATHYYPSIGPFNSESSNCYISTDGDSCVYYYNGGSYLNITTSILYAVLKNVGSTPNTFSFDYSCTFEDLSELGGGTSSCPESLIDVSYNNGNTSTISCDGINYITIDGLSTLTNSDVNYEYTPYFNINYRDEDNQLLTESYSKNILYLSGALFKKTFTGNNDWILNVKGNEESSFSGFIPTFDVVFTGDSLQDTGNIFNNFAQNSLTVLLSNIPSYIQYVIIFMILLFVIGLIRKFKRR